MTATVSSNPFLSTLNDRVNSYLAQEGEVSQDLTTFVSWVVANPPASPVKGEPKNPASSTGQVWVYLDSLVAGKHTFTRKGAVSALVAAGINEATASTQYQRWAKTRGYKGTQATMPALPAVGAVK